jgi:ATP/maltotriose-dependent transcriptional regulator MalT
MQRAADSQALLRQVYQSNLFVIPLDDEGQWFRYHQLFADLLLARLQVSKSVKRSRCCITRRGLVRTSENDK